MGEPTTTGRPWRRPWTLGAVEAECAVDPYTHVLLVRPEASATAARELERRLLGLRLAGRFTLIVHIVSGEHLSRATLDGLVRARRKLEARNGRLVVDADQPEVRQALACAGLELIDLEPSLAAPTEPRCKP